MSDEHLFIAVCVAMVALPVAIGVGIEMTRAGQEWIGDWHKRRASRRLRH